jgi:hypothetical protein
MEIVNQVLGNLDGWLNAIQEDVPVSQLHTLEDGMAAKTNATIVSISIPGEYAAREAHKALEAGLNVFIFSGNVSTEDEFELKQLAKQRELIVMGPDCGTSLIGGKGFGFTNVVRNGAGLLGGGQIQNHFQITTWIWDFTPGTGSMTSIRSWHDRVAQRCIGKRISRLVTIVSKPQGCRQAFAEKIIHRKL